MTAAAAKRELRALADPERAANSAWFFKTGPGEYGEGDRFLGVRVPQTRTVAKRFADLSLAQTAQLLRSSYHEERLLGLLIWVRQYQKGDSSTRQRIFDAYLKHTPYINNWDLVDSSAHYIVGPHLQDGNRRLLHELAGSENLWERRIAVLSTFAYINDRDYDDSLALAEKLLNDPEDLIHKAVGWMLREIGNRDLKSEEDFLKKHHKQMPRTMLRYAVEKFPETKRRKYVPERKAKKK